MAYLEVVVVNPLSNHSQSLVFVLRLLTVPWVIYCMVIELGYLESCFDEGLLDPDIHTAALHIDGAVDRLNDYLAGARHTQRAA